MHAHQIGRHLEGALGLRQILAAARISKGL